MTSEQSKEDKIDKELKKVKKRKPGRPKGITTKQRFKMSNGEVSEDQVFLYTPESTIPSKDKRRFLMLCDLMITSLGPTTVSEADIEEVALYYRDRIYCDHMYEVFAEAQGTVDTNMVSQLEKFNKSLEQRKQNLGSRFIDKGQKRKESKGESLIELFSKYESTGDSLEDRAKEMKSKIEEGKKNYTTTRDYMSSHSASMKRNKKDAEID